MHLATALGFTNDHDLDPTRSIKLGRFELGVEATQEAIRILAGGEFPRVVGWSLRDFVKPFYWLVSHRTEGSSEVFGFPKDERYSLSTAIEVALVRAIAAAAPEHHPLLLDGGIEIALGPPQASSAFRKLIQSNDPVSGECLLFADGSQAVIDVNTEKLLSAVVLSCFTSSFKASPIKFRFLEIYRMIEARFREDIKERLFANFDDGPEIALQSALTAIKSEMKQMLLLAETQKNVFEDCWTAIDALKGSNRFAAKLFKVTDTKEINETGKWAIGTALVYQIRCAIVHAADKKLIFDNFQDGDIVIKAVLPFLEQAALRLVGVQIS